MQTKAPALLLAAGAFVAVIAADGRSALEFAAGGAVAFAALVLLARTLSDSAVFIFGVLCVYASSLALAPDIVENNGKASYTAVVETASVSEKSQRAVCTLLDSSGHRRGNRRIGITVADIVPQIEPGDIVRFKAELRPTERYADIPHMAVQGFTERSMRLSAKAVVFKDDISVQGHSSELRYIPDAIKSRLEDFIHASSLTPQAAGMLAAATLGSDIDSATKQEMRDAGIAHLLCISGFHVGVLAAFVSLLLWPLVLSHGLRRYRSHITLCCVWFYALIVGFTPSVVRAAIMVSSFFIARMMQRDTLSINALALAFFIVLFIDPYRMYSAGFQLSFAAVAALLLFADRINPIPRKHPTGHRMASAICTPLAAMAGTAPLMMLWFNKLPLLGLLAHAITTVLFPLFMGAGAICVILDSAGIPCGAI
ncbi:MAG: ComEC/Rec2 family competence protein, partial [Muribaculaceae bacterium]|nr:ComEC/Rec2 family competence protein [Muribaculaceae bacterium]